MDQEIDFIRIGKKLYREKKIIIIISFVFFVIGIGVALTSAKQYSVTTVMVPQVASKENGLGKLSSLAAMAGFNLDMNSSSSELSPMVYPQIVNSIPFQKELMNTKLKFKDIDTLVSFYDYYTNPGYSKFNLSSVIKKYTIGIPRTILKAFRSIISEEDESSVVSVDGNEKFYSLSNEESAILKLLRGLVKLDVDHKMGTISLTTIMPEALPTAQLGYRAQELLQIFVIDYKTEKAQNKLDFVQKLYDEKKKDFADAQETLAKFRDRNKNVTTEMAKTEEVRLLNEYQIAFSVFTELAKQLENSRVQVKEDTPVFSIIEPINVPSDSFKPKRIPIVLGWLVQGFLIGVFWVFGKKYYFKIRDKWREEEFQVFEKE
ncbi:MAG: lipopolysaccharide biosynthesis protein [Bacteroidales bacterium]|nr:lipopolysaccharide biosynthesis protein [Bacteroidales bacterium]